MDSLNLALLSSSSSTLPFPNCCLRNYLKNPTRPHHLSFARPFSFPLRNYRSAPRSFTVSSSLARSHGPARIVVRNAGFASISSKNEQQTASVGVNSLPVPPPPSSQVGSPLFWVGVGVGLSALFTWVASALKKYAMQQAFKTMMNQMNTQNNQFINPAFTPGSPSPFPFPSAPGSMTAPSYSTSSTKTSPSYPTSSSEPATSPSAIASQTTVTVDVAATGVEAPAVDVKEETDTKEEPKKYAFVDVSPDETLPKSPFSNVEVVTETNSPGDAQYSQERVSQNGAIPTQSSGAFDSSQSTRKAGSFLSVDALEKMMEDPTVQKMVYPYLPEEMRNPATFKWMMQNPQYRQQLEEMLNNMSGSSEWDGRMMDSLKNFDLSSPEVKQQFDQIGLTPEEVISKIMANPDVAMAFQNPKIQQAIMDCQQNPFNIAKYQNDKEVMDVFNKISELFPGVSGPP